MHDSFARVGGWRDSPRLVCFIEMTALLFSCPSVACMLTFILLLPWRHTPGPTSRPILSDSSQLVPSPSHNVSNNDHAPHVWPCHPRSSDAMRYSCVHGSSNFTTRRWKDRRVPLAANHRHTSCSMLRSVHHPVLPANSTQHLPAMSQRRNLLGCTGCSPLELLNADFCRRVFEQFAD